MADRERIRVLNDADPRSDADHVLYWCIANRRMSWNHALDRAVEHGKEHELPVLVFEALSCDYRWASDRIHRFVIEGMTENRERCESAGVTYLPWVEPAPKAGHGLLDLLAARAACVVTDDYPTFGLDHMAAKAARRADVRFEAVDANGVLPMGLAGKAHPTAYSFRRFAQRNLLDWLPSRPAPRPLASAASLGRATVPSRIARDFPSGPLDPEATGSYPIDHEVAPVDMRGGTEAGLARWRRFRDGPLGVYKDDRNHPDAGAESGLSPYLHFGHVSAEQVVAELLEERGWDPEQASDDPKGARAGWWGLDESTEGFLDQIVTWRELGYGFCRHRDDHERYDSLPDWARETLAEHEDDPRDPVYERKELEEARTYDPLWNAAQRQLCQEGVIHNYMRMLWGKKILEWSPDPRTALDRMIHLNNRWAIDGRDPNSLTGIFWTLGRHDRPWGPERPIYGKVRYMTSKSTERKLRLADYLSRFGGDRLF